MSMLLKMDAAQILRAQNAYGIHSCDVLVMFL